MPKTCITGDSISPYYGGNETVFTMEIRELLVGPALYQATLPDDKDKWVWKAVITGRLWVNRPGQAKEEIWQRTFAELGTTSDEAVDKVKQTLMIHSPHPMVKWRSPDESICDPSWYRRQDVASIEPTIKPLSQP